MKTLALALLVPVALCTACGNSGEASSTTASSSIETTSPSSTPAVATSAPAPVNVVANPPAGAPASAETPTTAQVSLVSAAGSAVKGNLTLTNEGTAVSIRGEITGLAPGMEHGFHVHEVGRCALPDFSSAGDHFNPTNDTHGGPKSKTRHLGDIPNAKADQNGRATIDVTVEAVTLGDKDGAPADFLGKALVVHAMPDDYKTQPSGGSGDRIACGVIG